MKKSVYNLAFLHVSAEQGNGAEQNESYLNTANEYRKALTQLCATSGGGVYGSAVKQVATVQGGQG